MRGKRRSLTATAETFAAVGLLLVLLDGYAAWSVNLFGVADASGKPRKRLPSWDDVLFGGGPAARETS